MPVMFSIDMLLPVLVIVNSLVALVVCALSTRTLRKSTAGGESGEMVIAGAACTTPLRLIQTTQTTKNNSPSLGIDINSSQRRRQQSPGSGSTRILPHP